MQEADSRVRSLTTALRALAEDEARLGASTAVGARLRAESRSLGRARRLRGLAAVAAVAAVVFLAVAIPGWDTTERWSRPDGVGTGAGPGADVQAVEAATAFFPLIYANVPVTGGQIVRLEVPQTTLASFGVTPADVTQGARPDMVLAEVFVGEDGLARAVRFVRPVTTPAQKEQQQ